MFERPDADDAVNGLVELLPALQPHLLVARAVGFRENLFHMGLLVLAQGQSDDVDVVALDGSHHGRTPAAADIEQRHAGLQAQLAQGEVDFGQLRFFQRHVVALEIGAAVGLGGVQPEPEELVGQVVMGLDVFEMRF